MFPAGAGLVFRGRPGVGPRPGLSGEVRLTRAQKTGQSRMILSGGVLLRPPVLSLQNSGCGWSNVDGACVKCGGCVAWTTRLPPHSGQKNFRRSTGRLWSFSQASASSAVIVAPDASTQTRMRNGTLQVSDAHAPVNIGVKRLNAKKSQIG